MTNFLGGFLIGLGLVVPGVSGAVLAMILGLYEPIILALAKPLSNFKENLKLFIPVGLGAGVCLILFSRLLEFLFDQYPLLTLYLFFGLVLGSLPKMIKSANVEGFRLSYFPAFCLGLALLLCATNLPNLLHYSPEASIGRYIFLGAVAAIGLVVPGLSASFLLMAFGFYETLLRAINQFDFTILLPLALGLGPTIVLMSKGITWLFAKAHGYLSYLILGLLLGSLIVAFPGWPRSFMEVVLGGSLFIAGLFISHSFANSSKKI